LVHSVLLVGDCCPLLPIGVGTPEHLGRCRVVDPETGEAVHETRVTAAAVAPAPAATEEVATTLVEGSDILCRAGIVRVVRSAVGSTFAKL
jgi:hypothetical protein